MSVLKMVLSDIDSTLIHPHKQHDENLHEGIAGLLHIGRGSYIDPRTIEGIRSIMERGVFFVFITSRRMATYRNVEVHVSPNMGIVEDGCIVLNEQGQVDKTWLDTMRDTIGTVEDIINGVHENGDLWCFLRELEAMDLASTGISTTDEGFLASFKVVLPADGKDLVFSEVVPYLKSKGIEIPSSLKFSYNSKYNSLVIVPATAGKVNAAKYVLDVNEVKMVEVAALGDDYNDEEMLQQAGWALTLGSAKPYIKELVSQREQGFVVPEADHEGTLSMLGVINTLIAESQ